MVLSLSYKFSQQILTAWEPRPNYKHTIAIFVLLCIIYAAIGEMLLLFSAGIKEYAKRYDLDCANKTICEFNFTVVELMNAPVFVYYQLDDFYQNHRKYLESLSIEQLQGNYLSTSELQSCAPVISNRDLGLTVNRWGYRLDPDEPAYPCGLMAMSVFNDTYTIIDSNDQQVNVTETGITWSDDVEKKYKNLPIEDYRRYQWINVENEHFMVWMRGSATSTFRKLYGKIEGTKGHFYQGRYKIIIHNNYPTSGSPSAKWIIISNSSEFGGKNFALSYLYLFIGAVCIMIATSLWVRQIAIEEQRLEKEKKKE